MTRKDYKLKHDLRAIPTKLQHKCNPDDFIYREVRENGKIVVASIEAKDKNSRVD